MTVTGQVERHEVARLTAEEGPSRGAGERRATVARRRARAVRAVRSWWRALGRWLGQNTLAPTILPAPLRTPLAAYALPAVTQALVFGLVVVIVQTVPTFHFPEALLVLAVVLLALAWGAGPALLAALVGTVLLALALAVAPAHPLAIDRREDAVGVALLLIVGVAVGIAAGQAVAARRRAEEAAARMDDFLGIVSHELRNPLTAAKVSTQLAARQCALAERATSGDRAAQARQRVALARVETQLARIEALVEDLLDAARARSGKLALRPERCDLAVVVRDAVEEQRLANPERAITLALPAPARAAPAPMMVLADPRRVGQVVTNYLTNALKYSPGEQPVQVRLATMRDRATLAVRDTGPGLAPADRARVWERGYRAPGVTVLSGTGVGLGLGLTISKAIIERQGGQVGVRSAPGHGSTFWFWLPLAR